MVNDENIIRLKKPDMFSLERTLDCGQAFRWESDESGVFRALLTARLCAWGKRATACFFTVWKMRTCRVFLQIPWPRPRLPWNYRSLQWRQISVGGRKSLPRYQNFASGAVEALCSFIISQNNNIPRIKGIIKGSVRALAKSLRAECTPSPPRSAVRQGTRGFGFASRRF